MSSSLQINDEMRAFDRKDRAYYDNFTDEDRKKFSTYLMLRYGASVMHDAAHQAYYLMAANEYLNINFFNINKHPKLQWLLCTAVSPGKGTQKHYWLAAKKKQGDNNKAEKFLIVLFPQLKSDEIKLLAEINDKDDLKHLAREHGWDDKRIKSDL